VLYRIIMVCPVLVGGKGGREFEARGGGSSESLCGFAEGGVGVRLRVWLWVWCERWCCELDS